MKGIIARALSAAVCAASVLATGCCGGMTYNDLVDPCWPERYNAMARAEVNEAMEPQIRNGHVLDQTVWNDDFEAGTDKLTIGGQERLKYMARRRPHADPAIYVQNSQDVVYDPAKPEETTARRGELNGKRVMAVQNFLSSYSPTGLPFQVAIHDPADMSQPSLGAQRAATARNESFQGVMSNVIRLGGGAGSGSR